MAQKFILAGTGTKGDLLPMLTIAEELQRRGRDCHVLGNEDVSSWAKTRGVPFTSVAPPQCNNLTSVEQNFGTYVFPAYQPTFDFVRTELARGTDVVLVNAENYASTTLMAERHQLPLCRFTLTPYRLRSLDAPHWPWSEKARGRLGRAFRRYTLPALYEQRYACPYVISRINEFRGSLGLAPITSLRSLDPLVTHQICLFPEWYCPKASDWPSNLDCVGFPLPPPTGAIPESLQRWLADNDRPIVFTPGTGVVDVDAFFEHARDCCERLARPGLFLSPNLDSARRGGHSRIFHLDYVDLALVLPHSSLLVHHGGIGTTARAFEAGVPQIISPQAYDQPDNGHRVAVLGAGAMIPRAELSGATLAGAARTLLESEQTADIVREIAGRCRQSRAIASFVDILERRFAPFPPSTQRRRSDATQHMALC